MSAQAFWERRQSTVEALVSSSTLNLISKLCGYLKQLLIAAVIGFSVGTDAVFMALALLSIFVLFGDTFDSLGVPRLVRARGQGEAEFREVASQLFTIAFVLATACTLIVAVGHPLLTGIAAGFSDEARGMLRVSLLLLLPWLFSYFIVQHLGALFRADRRFHIWYLATVMISITGFVVVGLAVWLVSRSAYVVAVSYSIQQVAAAVGLGWVGRHYLVFRWRLDRSSLDLLKQLGYLALLYGVFQLYLVVDRTFGSFLPEGSISALTYGLFLGSLLTNIAQVDQILMVPLSEHNVEKRSLQNYFLTLLVLTIPIAVYLFAFAPELLALAFGYGRFTGVELDATASATQYYALALPLIYLYALSYRAMQVLGRIRALAAAASVSVLVNAGANYLFVFVLDLGLIGIPLATTVSYVFLLLGTMWLLAAEDRAPQWRALAPVATYLLVVSGGAAYALRLVEGIPLLQHIIPKSILFGIGVGGAILVYARRKQLAPPVTLGVGWTRAAARRP
jgi:putative peptidoglycan lipid II flippase